MKSDKKLERIERKLARAPKDVANWLTLIEIHLRGGEVQLALAAVERALVATDGHPGLRELQQTLRGSLESAQEPWSADLERLAALVDARDFPSAVMLGEELTRCWPEQSALWGLLAESRHGMQDLAGAVSAAERAVELEPESANVLTNLGALLTAAGDSIRAESILRQALEIAPTLPSAHANLGRALREQGELAGAEASYLRALALQPDQAEVHHNLACLQEELGQLQEAEASYRRALKLNARLAAAANNLANLLSADGRVDEARSLLERSIGFNPTVVQLHYNLGNLLRTQQQLEPAVRAYQRVLELDSNMVDALHNLGLTQAELGYLDDAEESHRRALALAPDRIDLIETLGNLLGALDHFDQAVEQFERAVDLAPDCAALRLQLGHALAGCLQYQRGEEAYRQALELAPDNDAMYCALAVFLGRRMRYGEALSVIQQGSELVPESVRLAQSRARILMEIGQLDESEHWYRKAVELQPSAPSLRSDMLVAMSFTGHWSPLRIRAEAEQWELQAVPQAEREAAAKRRFTPAARGRRRLRIGFLSSELGQHPVAYFLRPWLRELNPDRYELFAYPGRNRNDAKVHIFKELIEHWHPLAGLSDARAAERIRADQIDILIDTTGHDTDRRMGVIARRAAPIQCHYIGYYATTGLSQMDYFIGDAVLIPPRHDAHFTEQVWRLPRTRYVYEPLADAPEPRWWPDPDGQVWFGSFNNLIKVRDESLALWARVLRALPEAKLALKDSKGANRPTQLRVLETLRAHGVDEDRVAFLAQVPNWTQHMDYYNRLDVALDSVPFNSATTGFDALWMGCPLVTLAGDRLAGRQAASLLTGLGRGDWIAQNEADYVRIAVELAQDRNQRQRIRETQREQMLNSELCDGPGLARVLEETFEDMWALWLSRAKQDGKRALG